MFHKWKKLIYKLIIIASVLGMSKTVHAEETRSFADWVDSYGVIGDRVLAVGSNGECIGIVSAEQKSVSISYNNKVMVFTTDPHEYAVFRGPFSQYPSNGGYIDHYWTQLTSLDLGSVYSPFQGVNFSSVFHLDNDNPVYYRASTNLETITENNCDIEFTNITDFLDEMNRNDWENPANKDPSSPVEGKMPYFYMKKSGSNLGLAAAPISSVEYTITWDTTGSFVEGHESDYGIRVYVTSNVPEVNNENSGGNFFTGWDKKKAINNSDVYPTLFANKAFAFTYNQLEKMYTLWGGYLEHSFIIAIQIVDDLGNPVNNKFTTFRITKVHEIEQSHEYEFGNGDDKPPTKATNLTKREDGVMDYTDGRPSGQNTNQDGTRDSNGSSVSPQAQQAGINNWDPTQAQQNGIDYGTSLTDMSTNLQGLVNHLSTLSSAFAVAYSFLPAWLMNIIAVSIGMIVVIGVVKLIVR